MKDPHKNPRIRKNTLTDEFIEKAQNTLLEGIVILFKELLTKLLRKADPDFDPDRVRINPNGQ